jgi:hypothetical protein
LNDAGRVAAILVFGFSGFYDFKNPLDNQNEELTPVLLRISRRIPVHVFITSTQSNTGLNTLWNEISRKYPERAHIKGESTLIDFWCMLMGKGVDKFEEEYGKWRSRCGLLSSENIEKELNYAGL